MDVEERLEVFTNLVQQLVLTMATIGLQNGEKQNNNNRNKETLRIKP